MAVKQIWIPMTAKMGQEAAFLAEHSTAGKAQLKQTQEELKHAISAAEAELSDAFNEGFSMLAEHIVDLPPGMFLYTLLVKRDEVQR